MSIGCFNFFQTLIFFIFFSVAGTERKQQNLYADYICPLKGRRQEHRHLHNFFLKKGCYFVPVLGIYNQRKNKKVGKKKEKRKKKKEKTGDAAQPFFALTVN